jgi:hypothetical protein
MLHRLPLALATLSLLAPGAFAAPQDPAGGGPREPRESRVDARTSRSSTGASRSWRRVVKDGVVVEEERTPDPALERWLEETSRGGAGDAERLLEELRRGLEREGSLELPPGLGELPWVAPPKLGGGAASSSHVRRKVVVNGETIVDEELRDGSPVRPSAGVVPLPLPGTSARPLPGRAEARAEAHASSRSGGTESSETSGSASESSERDARGAGRPKAPPKGARPELSEGSGRFRVGPPMPARPLPPRSPGVAPTGAPARTSSTSARDGIR